VFRGPRFSCSTGSAWSAAWCVFVEKVSGVLEKDPGVLLKDPGVVLKDPGVLSQDPRGNPGKRAHYILSISLGTEFFGYGTLCV